MLPTVSINHSKKAIWSKINARANQPNPTFTMAVFNLTSEIDLTFCDLR